MGDHTIIIARNDGPIRSTLCAVRKAKVGATVEHVHVHRSIHRQDLVHDVGIIVGVTSLVRVTPLIEPSYQFRTRSRLLEKSAQNSSEV
jgi:hypothetical protein